MSSQRCEVWDIFFLIWRDKNNTNSSEKNDILGNTDYVIIQKNVD
jgi:hypothetical protein